MFLSADYEAILKHNNRFEDGYDSGTWGATLGGDYQINNRLIAGLALNYSNEDGEFDDGGGFDTASYRVIAFTSVVPMEGAFVDLTAGYARQHYDRKRRITFTPVGGATTRGTASADFDGNEVSVGTLAGYDHPIDNITVGPRAGLNWIHTQIDSYKEDGDSGLELRFSDLSETSLEGSLGVQASAAIRTAFAVVVPQLNADWVHEFENDQYKRDAYFVYDTLKRRFSFENEEPDRNFARIGLSVSAVLPNGLTPFASFRTIQWNDNQTSYKGVIGLRTEL